MNELLVCRFKDCYYIKIKAIMEKADMLRTNCKIHFFDKSETDYENAYLELSNALKWSSDEFTRTNDDFYYQVNKGLHILEEKIRKGKIVMATQLSGYVNFMN